jgi:hypothetical protein
MPRIVKSGASQAQPPATQLFKRITTLECGGLTPLSVLHAFARVPLYAVNHPGSKALPENPLSCRLRLRIDEAEPRVNACPGRAGRAWEREAWTSRKKNG